MLQQCIDICVIIGGRSTTFEISGCAIDLIDVVRNVNVHVDVDLCFMLSCDLFGKLTILDFPVNLSGDSLLPNIKHWKISTSNMPGTLKGW